MTFCRTSRGVVRGQLALPDKLAADPMDRRRPPRRCLLRWVQREFSSRQQPEPPPPRCANLLLSLVSQLAHDHSCPNAVDFSAALQRGQRRRDLAGGCVRDTSWIAPQKAIKSCQCPVGHSNAAVSCFVLLLISALAACPAYGRKRRRREGLRWADIVAKVDIRR